MIRVSNADLPATPARFPGRGPLLKIVTGSSGPIARIASTTAFGIRPGFDRVAEPTPAPLYAAPFFSLALNIPQSTSRAVRVTRANILLGPNGQDGNLRLSRLGDLDNPLPRTFWADGQQVNLYCDRTSPAITPGDILELMLLLPERVPPPLDPDAAVLVYELDLADAFPAQGDLQVDRVEAEGRTFVRALDENDPQPGEFTQAFDGDTHSPILRFYATNDSNAPGPTRPLTITATRTQPLPEPVAIAATFSLSLGSITFLDEAIYLGRTYLPTADVFRPQPLEFIASREQVTLLVPVAQGRWLRGTAVDAAIAGIGSLGSATYESEL